MNLTIPLMTFPISPDETERMALLRRIARSGATLSLVKVEVIAHESTPVCPVCLEETLEAVVFSQMEHVCANCGHGALVWSLFDLAGPVIFLSFPNPQGD